SLTGNLVDVQITSDDALQGEEQDGDTALPAESTAKNFATDIKQKNFLRIESQRLDSLIDSIGELVMTGAALKALQPQTADERYTDQMALLERQVEMMRDSAMSLRTFSLSEVFRRFERVVRDVSAQAGKQVELEISGGETEIDK